MNLKLARIETISADVHIPDVCPACSMQTNKSGRMKPLLVRSACPPVNIKAANSKVYETAFYIRDNIPNDSVIIQIICGNRTCGYIFYSAFGDAKNEVITTQEELEKLKTLLEL
jgi:hypothetical protein